MAIERDVSKRTITVLVVLTVVISALGTLSVLGAAASLRSGKISSSSTSGWVGLEIIESHEPMVIQAPPATGEVVLNIIEV